MTEEDLYSFDLELPKDQDDRVKVLEMLGFYCYPEDNGSILLRLGNIYFTIGKHTMFLSNIVYEIGKFSINEES